MPVQVKIIVNRIFSSRTYVLTEPGREEVWLVDCGDFDKVQDCIGNRRIAGVLLTHAHADHIYGLNALLAVFPDCRIYTNAFGKEALMSSKLNLSRYHDEFEPFVIEKPDNIVVVQDETAVSVLGEEAVFYETPGHDPGCVTILMGNLLFTGDAYIPWKKTVTTFPKSDKAAAERSVSRILNLAEGRTVYCGHERTETE